MMFSDDQQGNALLGNYAQIILLALERLNNLHKQMQSAKRDALVVQSDRDRLQAEYDAIKARLEKRLPGFVIIYMYGFDFSSHVLVPVAAQKGGVLNADR